MKVTEQMIDRLMPAAKFGCPCCHYDGLWPGGNEVEQREIIRELLEKALTEVSPASSNTNGCGRKLAPGQHWSFCGETDMGQTAPALCVECGGNFKLSDHIA